MNEFGSLGYFGKGFVPPPPPPPPVPTGPTITPQEELAILQATMPIPEPEPSFLRRNAVPLFVGGGALILGVIGFILLIKI